MNGGLQIFVALFAAALVVAILHLTFKGPPPPQ
jgi:hypothetical protein